MKIHHLGIAVKNLEQATKKYELLGFKSQGKVIEDVRRNVRAQFMENDGNCIELVATLDETLESPIRNILKSCKLGNSIPYHWCGVVPDLEKKIKEMQDEKFILISPPEEAIAFNNKKIAFMMNREIGMIELLES